MWLVSVWHTFYCSGLELNLQYHEHCVMFFFWKFSSSILVHDYISIFQKVHIMLLAVVNKLTLCSANSLGLKCHCIDERVFKCSWNDPNFYLYDISHWIRTYISKLISTLWIFKNLASNNPRFSWTVCVPGRASKNRRKLETKTHWLNLPKRLFLYLWSRNNTFWCSIEKTRNNHL